jgi:hypothetical protein
VAPDTMAVRLHLRAIRALAVLVDALDELVVASQAWHTPSQEGIMGARGDSLPLT